MEMYNEFMIMCFNYHTIVFSDFCLNADFQFDMGDSFVTFLCLVIGGNVILMGVMTIEKFKRMKKLEKLERHQQMMLADLK